MDTADNFQFSQLKHDKKYTKSSVKHDKKYTTSCVKQSNLTSNYFSLLKL